jgi:hypothetical protein
MLDVFQELTSIIARGEAAVLVTVVAAVFKEVPCRTG